MFKEKNVIQYESKEINPCSQNDQKYYFNIPLQDPPTGKKLQRTYTETATHSYSALSNVISISIDSSTCLMETHVHCKVINVMS